MNSNSPIETNTPPQDKQTIAITGSSGYIGQRLILFLQQKNYHVIRINRSLLYGESNELKDCIAGCDAIINLAGASINQRWTQKNKKTIIDSRILCTRHLVNAINDLSPTERPKHFLSVSAVGIYQNGITHTETSSRYDKGFLGSVVTRWENEMSQLHKSVKCSIFRLGIVIGQDAKIIQRLSPIFKLGLGGSIGRGTQAFPFVYIDDVLRAFYWGLSEGQDGTYNLCTNEFAQNKDFTKAFAQAVNRPAFFKIPAVMMRLLFGEMSVLVLKSPRIDASKISNSGFRFTVPSIQEALDKAVNK